MKKLVFLVALLAAVSGLSFAAPNFFMQSQSVAFPALAHTQSFSSDFSLNPALGNAALLNAMSKTRALDVITINLMQGNDVQNPMLEELSGNPRYASSKRLRDAGIGLFAASMVMAPVGAGLFAAGYFAGMILLTTTPFFLVPGVIMWAVGQARVNRYEDAAYNRMYEERLRQ